MDKKNIIKQMARLGFKGAWDEEKSIFAFKFEDINILYLPDEKDVNFLYFAEPKVYEVTEDNRPFVLELMNEVNQILKYAKTFIHEESVWISYEIRLFGNEDIKEVLEHCLHMLEAAHRAFFKKINGGEIIEKEKSND